METVATKRNDGLHTVQITSDVDAALEAYLRRYDKKKRDTVNRILLRFLSQTPAVQSALLGEVDEGLEPDYARAFEALARELRDQWEATHGVRRVGTPRPGTKPPAG